MKDIWLTDKGELIYIDSQSSHNEYAIDLLSKEKGKPYWEFYLELDMSYPYQVLHERGWIRIKIVEHRVPKIEIYGDGIDLTKPMRNTMDPAMNERQIRIAKKLCDENDTEFHVAINDKRFW